MKLNDMCLNIQDRNFSCTLDAGSGYDEALAALNLAPDFGYVIDIVGDFRVRGDGEMAYCELDGDCFLVNPKTGQEVAFAQANLDTSEVEELLFEVSSNDMDVQQEYYEILQAAAKAAWESYNDR